MAGWTNARNLAATGLETICERRGRPVLIGYCIRGWVRELLYFSYCYLLLLPTYCTTNATTIIITITTYTISSNIYFYNYFYYYYFLLLNYYYHYLYYYYLLSLFLSYFDFIFPFYFIFESPRLTKLTKITIVKKKLKYIPYKNIFLLIANKVGCYLKLASAIGLLPSWFSRSICMFSLCQCFLYILYYFLLIERKKLNLESCSAVQLPQS